MKKAIITVALLSGFYTSFGQETKTAEPHQMTTVALRQLDSLFHYLDKSGLYNGNILVGVAGKKAATAVIGYSDIRNKEKLSEESPFELASVSKQFTAVGILRLEDAGKIKLDQALESIFPTFPYKGITIRHLLNHTSGLPDYEQMMIENWDRSKIATNSDVVSELTRLHPKESFAPGTSWEYSNTGYAILAAVIEKVSGKSYAAYMLEQVFKPLNMKHTFIYTRRYAPQKVKGYAFGYVKNEDGAYVLPDSIEDYSYVRYLDGITGDGTVNSTIGDLLIWDNAVRDQKLISTALWKESLTAPIIAGKSTDYGFGWEIVSHPQRGKVIRHMGGWPGYVINNVLYLDKDVSLIYLSNKELPKPVMQATYDAVKNIVFGLPFKFPEPVKEKAIAAIDKRIYERYVGTYASKEMEGFELKIFTEAGELFAQATGQGPIKISPESETLFFVKDLPIGIEFKIEEAGPANTLILLQNGDHEFTRK